MRVRVLLLIGMTAMLVAVLACSPSGDDTANRGLVNTSWTVISIDGVPMTARPTMTFAEDGTVSGSGGCNQYSAAFRMDGAAIAVGQVASTLMGCDGDRGAQEAAFLGALQGATTWRQADDGNLVLGGAAEILSGPGVAEGPPGDEPTVDLGGTDWTLVEMGGTADFARLSPSLLFGSDGMVTGFAGCNKFSAPFTVGDGDMSLGSLVTTKMACEPPASAVEAAYLEALAGATTWSVSEVGQLTLGGVLPLTFRRS